MAIQTRIYVVLCPNGDRRLVDAASSAQAIRYVVKTKYSAHVATQRDFVDAMSSGLKVEYATHENAGETLGEQMTLPGFENESNGIEPNRENNSNNGESQEKQGE